jgi:hypothetical protein
LIKTLMLILVLMADREVLAAVAVAAVQAAAVGAAAEAVGAVGVAVAAGEMQ